MKRSNPISILAGALLLVFIAGVFWAILPLLSVPPLAESTRIFDRNGRLLYVTSLHQEGTRDAVSFDQLPESYVRAVIAIEDERFYRHHGVDARALLRVLKEAVSRSPHVSGASTLEQQVVKNLYFPAHRRTVFQKGREMVAGVFWSLTHSKEETLEAYANTISFGNGALGIQSAAQTYFHTNVEELSAAQSALLAGIVNAPTALDPYRHQSKAMERMRTVVARMQEQGSLTEEEAAEIKNTNIYVYQPIHDIEAPHFVLGLLEDLSEAYPDIETGGYTVVTTLDAELQAYAENVVTRRLAELSRQHVTNAAALALDPQSGDVLAYVGSADFFQEGISGQVDMVQALRQPGSALKPFVYFQAFLQGLSPSTVIADVPTRFETATGEPYYPRNYSFTFSGPVSIRQALGSSLNIPAVKVLNQIGLDRFVGTLGAFGMTFPQTPEYYGLGMVLGGAEVTLFDATRAYAELGLYARSVEPRRILELRDRNGVMLERASPSIHEPLFTDPRQEAAAWLVKDILTDPLARAPSFGEASRLDIQKDIAVKTGTTKDFRDNWAFGTTPQFTLGVWVGNADNSPMQGVSGITGAIPIWHDVMRFRFDKQGDVLWQHVDGIATHRVCTTSGLLATPACPKTRDEVFLSGNEPTVFDDWYQALDIDAATGKRAASGCAGSTIEKVFLMVPAEYAAWVASARIEQAPVEDCTGARVAGADGKLTILSPLDGEVFLQDALLAQAGDGIPFIAGGSEQPTFQWELDGVQIEAKTPVYFWKPISGSHELRLEGSDQTIRFEIR